MAWQARLSQPVVAQGRNVVVYVEYYDDGTPAVTLHAQVFSFPPAWSATDMGDVIRAEGQAVRAAQARAGALNAQFPQASTVIAIP